MKTTDIKFPDINRLYETGQFTWLDVHFARLIRELDGADSPFLFWAAALVSSRRRQGHICLEIPNEAGQPLFSEKSWEKSRGKDEKPLLHLPKAEPWLDYLLKSPVVGAPGDYTPLVLDEKNRLYLYRYWKYQQELAALVRARADRDIPFDANLLSAGLKRLFPGSGEPDYQKIAAFTALTRSFCVISGGPGTGKTATVAKILALLLEQAKNDPVHIKLAAPTGKAAARLQEAITRARDCKQDSPVFIDCADTVKNAMPDTAATLHRLLGTIPNSPYFKHNAGNPLPVDAVIVDEASMIDFALMSKLVQALPDHARLILLGDKDQLSSVEAGAALGDICDTGHEHPFSWDFCREYEQITGDLPPDSKNKGKSTPMGDCIVQLQKTFRFKEHIGRLSRHVNDGDAARAANVIRDTGLSDTVWQDLPDAEQLAARIKGAVIKGFTPYLREKKRSFHEIFRDFEGFRILCPLRGGPYGVNAVNHLIEKILAAAGLIDMTPGTSEWYPGRPVMVTKNDYHLELFNGDVGIALQDPESNGSLRVFFSGSKGEVKKFRTFRLPDHETVYAMTVHKSQGSEFDHVLMLLPDRESPVLTRELIYTGITRAREKIEIRGKDEIFRQAVEERIHRASGLRDALWESGPPEKVNGP